MLNPTIQLAQNVRKGREKKIGCLNNFEGRDWSQGIKMFPRQTSKRAKKESKQPCFVVKRETAFQAHAKKTQEKDCWGAWWEERSSVGSVFGNHRHNDRRLLCRPF